jgi:hypothetical protein
MEDIKHACTFPHFMLPLVARVYKQHLMLETWSEVGINHKDRNVFAWFHLASLFSCIH